MNSSRLAIGPNVLGRLSRIAFALLSVLVLAASASAQEPVADALTREREQQTGTAITILFDNSGSMKNENKIQQAKSAFRSWLQTVPVEYKFSLITFEDKGRLVVPLGEKTRDIVAQRVSQLEAKTSTPICGALKIAREQIEKRRRDVTPYERHVVLIFTDGQETVDQRGVDGVREDITALRAATVEVVGVGFHGEGDYMKGVATRFALANNEYELKQGLAKVDAEVGSVDDLVVTPEDLAALKQFRTDAPKAVSSSSVEPEAGPESATPVEPGATTSANPKSPFPVKWIIFAFIAWAVVRRLAAGKSTPQRKR